MRMALLAGLVVCPLPKMIRIQLIIQVCLEFQAASAAGELAELGSAAAQLAALADRAGQAPRQSVAAGWGGSVKSEDLKI